MLINTCNDLGFSNLTTARVQKLYLTFRNIIFMRGNIDSCSIVHGNALRRFETGSNVVFSALTAAACELRTFLKLRQQWGGG
jgi:hypothetical protein